jgi:phosphopantothenoylcysteine decarboxylase/phosphopantothenate--cysteine ligase
MHSILLIITGSIAAKKSIELCHLLIKNKINIDIILTKSALKFVKKKDFQDLNIKNIYSDIFNKDLEKKFGHISLSRKNNLILVYPATANFIAKIAAGKADDLASASIVAANNKRIFIAPAMNVNMWDNNITRENIIKLESNSYEILYPESGRLACGDIGFGRLINPSDCFSLITNYLKYHKLLHNYNILITAGGTREKIDPVRYIGNFSSGKQAIAIAKKFSEYGASVTVIKANTNCHIPANLNIIEAESALEIFNIVKQELTKKKYDIGIFAAAISDYIVENYSPQKIKKSDNIKLNINLKPNIDILKQVGNSSYRPKILIGFAAETENHQENAYKKLQEKNCNFIILNDVSDGKVFGMDDNKISLISRDENVEISGSKLEIADKIIPYIAIK